MKKLIVLIMSAALMILSLAACNPQTDEEKNPDHQVEPNPENNNPGGTTTPENPEDNGDTTPDGFEPDENGNIHLPEVPV